MIVMIDWGNFSGFFSTGIPSVVLYPSVLITAVLLLIGMIWKRVKNMKGYTICVLLLEYVFIVLCSTIICRNTVYFEFGRLQLIPFWTYKAVIEHTPGVKVWDIVLNVALFFPLGFLVKLLKPSLSILWVIGFALCLSVFIESSQFIFEKGAAQIDDVIHNVIGASLGWLLAKSILSRSQNKATTYTE